MTQFEKTFSFMKKPVVIIAYIILVILSYFFLDKTVAIHFHDMDLRTNLHLLNIFTALGQWKIYIALFFLAGLYFHYIQVNKIYETRAWYLLGCIFIVNLFGFAIKISLSRARPDLLFDHNLFGFYWFQKKDLYWSFPSGHALTITALAAGLGVIFPRYFYLLITVAILVALSRVLLYRHYPSDVMSGFYISILLIGWFTEYLKRRHYLDKLK